MNPNFINDRLDRSTEKWIQTKKWSIRQINGQMNPNKEDTNCADHVINQLSEDPHELIFKEKTPDWKNLPDLYILFML